MDLTISVIIVICASLAITALAERILIPKLRSMKMGQKILEIGPRWHKSKEGTPTMGGIGFIVTSLIITAGAAVAGAVFKNMSDFVPFFLTMLFACLNGLVGMIDDLTKFKKHQNEGLTPIQKIILQTVLAGAYVALLRIYGFVDTRIYIPYFDISADLGFVYYFFMIILILGVVNCANLTDGIDGLASSVVMVIGIFFTVAAIRESSVSVGFASSLIIGCAVGFLFYNFHPARVFMGDTGSLFFGFMAVGCAIMLDNPVIILVCGIIYVAEGASDIIQVIVYKLTCKRVFKMAPIHHHFEKCGWSEVRVVTVFSIVTMLACVAAWFGLR